MRESYPLEGPFTLRCLGDSHILVHALGGVRDRLGVAVCDITLASMTRRLRFRREAEHPVEEVVARPVSDGPRNSLQSLPSFVHDYRNSLLIGP